ncbi:MAG: cysteine--tRNA ligase [Clostridiales bacterium]|nr:cysteine--tRNA ligase [Clostridiales bacterium]
MKVYNTLTRKKEEFVPIEENKVKMYVCGPTVYGLIHIGNARPYVIFDTIRRYMEYKGYEVSYVQNFTDVDDKIIKRANEEGVSTEVITERYIKEAVKDAEGLNVEPATYNPHATKEMPHIIEMIQTLIDKGYAYAKNGSVYYDTKAFADYGKLSGKNLDDLIAGASNRVDVDTDKKCPADFVLWKPKKEGEPYWESPWSEGRPGWHIECSVMAKEYLGDTIDIHAGGEDLIFPHHENEIAQSEAANGKPFANYWLHNGFINVDNEKMSKSKGNFFTLRDIAAEVPYDVIRFFILNGHYRSPINFSRELMEAAGNGLLRIKNCVKGLNFHNANSTGSVLSPEEEALVKESAKFKADFEKAMDDDFNTADAIASIFEFVKFANTNVKETSTTAFGEAMLKGIEELCDILGIKTADEEKSEVDTETIEALIAERTAAKKARDFAKADEIRNKLSDMGVVIEDTRQGVRWSFK